MSYCPGCLCNSLSLATHGVVHVMINNKALQTNQFLYNTTKDTKEDLNQRVEEKIDEFFKWYSSFQNKDPISEITLSSCDFTCKNSCKMRIGQKYSVINIIINADDLMKILKKQTDKYGLKLEIKGFSNIDA